MSKGYSKKVSEMVLSELNNYLPEIPGFHLHAEDEIYRDLGIDPEDLEAMIATIFKNLNSPVPHPKDQQKFWLRNYTDKMTVERVVAFTEYFFNDGSDH